MFSVSSNAEIYNVTKIDSELIGTNFKIEKPMAYISGLSNCNALKREIALNTDC